MSSRPFDLLRAIRGGRAVITVLAGLLLLLIAGRALTGMYVEILWQSQTGYVGVFWRRVLWEWGVRAIGGLSVALLVYANLRIASTTLGGIQIRRRFGNIEISEQIPKRYVTWAMLTAAGLLGFWFGASIPGGVGRQFLLAISAPAWGATEPVLGRDLGFYTFWFPVLGSVVTYALIVVFLVFTLATAGYAATGALAWNRGRLHTHGVARLHLGGILSAFFLFLAVRLYLGRYDLLLNGNSGVQQIFGFTDAMARLPALQTLTVISIAAAAATFWGAWKNRPWPVIASFTGVTLGSVLIVNLYPSLIQSFRVEPNELERERPYIQHSLEFTRRGFGLDDLDRRTFDFDADAAVDWTDAAEQFAGLPVWGTGPLLRTYRESQAAYPYYDFDDITIDRYTTASGPVPVALSVRQVDEQGIQDRNWQNLHLREIYLAGQGAVASIASTRSTEGRPEFVVRGIPPVVSPSSVGSVDVTLDRPQIYFGTQTQQEYGVVTPGPDQYLAPDGSTGVAGVDFPEGIHLRSSLRTALLAWHFGAANLLFSSELTSESRLIHRREVVSRALAIAPFLRFPEAPYPVLHDGRVVWILEGFTGTAAFPLSQLQSIGVIRPMVSYIRNSVKVTMDAVTGNTRFYRVPIEDPLADAYEAAYPGLIQPIEGMPQGLRDHLRYPKSLMQVQGDVLLQYHQETAAAFHAQQDVWREPQELSDGPQPVPYRPEYGIYRLPGESEPRFQLTTVFVPFGRDNLTAILVARSDDDGTPETILIDVPVDDEVLGPRLVEAQIEQDPLISQQLTLWRSGGSTVWTGHMHLIPVGNRLLYMEAIFFAAEADAIPELRRFVVSDGVEIVMAESLTDAISQISDGAVAAPSLAEADAGAAPSLGLDVGAWPASALEILDQAENRARAGDWQGYGEALDQLRALLERLRAGR